MLHALFTVIYALVSFTLVLLVLGWILSGLVWLVAAPFVAAEKLMGAFTRKFPAPPVDDTIYAPEEIRARQEAFLAEYRANDYSD